MQDVLLAADRGVPERVLGLVGEAPFADRPTGAVNGVQKQAAVLPGVVGHDNFDGDVLAVGNIVGRLGQ